MTENNSETEIYHGAIKVGLFEQQYSI